MKKPEHCYVDIHVLQTVPPSCVNRDDTGSPKTAVYGGVTRARVSSQAWKRAVRLEFRNLFAPEQLGTRTKRIVGEVAAEIERLEPLLLPGMAEEKAQAALESAGLSIKDAEKGTDALFFLSSAQAKALAELTVQEDGLSGKAKKEAYQAALKAAPSIDMALFGRMVAADPSLNYDAAAQVAHSISTHAVQNEFDYFTAVDDRAPEDNAGAGHIGTTEFNSATLYRYATVNVQELAGLLGAEDAVEAVKGFVRAFCSSMPTGKQNSFANRTTPDLVYVTVRGDQPVNLAGAFEKPVRAGTEGFVIPSEKALASYARQTYASFVSAPLLALGCSRTEELSELAELLPLSELVERLSASVKAYLTDGGEA
ncbi:MAG: type I-E CRISPR-associated protein Cas7/Cse4/CasC [Oscillospiraceae bacterium]|nr:type I-E CRISPR-associated protein Cas7/Cse4/CasC [Oscillospiraceae bacterium]